MGRAPCCDKANVKKGPWSPEEDAKLKSYIEQNGTGGNWIALPQKIGLKRCGKSCRLRWLNYLRPNIKHGGFSEEEDRIICSLYGSIGSRWSIIAAQLPGRTDNDIKNYWNTRLKKKLLGKQRNSASSTSGRRSKRSLLVSDHHHHTENNSTMIPSVVLPNSANFNFISNSEAMFPYTSWPPIVAGASNPNSGGFGEMRSLLMKLDQNVYYDSMANLHPPLIANDHHEIENDQLVDMMCLDGGQMNISPHNDLGAVSSFPRELEELMLSSTSNQATQRMGGLDQFLGWDQDHSNSTVMINNNVGAAAGSETSCGSMGSWCEMSSLISLPMGAGNASCTTEGIPPQDPVFDHQLIRYTGN